MIKEWARSIVAQYEKEEAMLRNIQTIAGLVAGAQPRVGDLGGVIK